jgi:hypothetical protein
VAGALGKQTRAGALSGGRMALYLRLAKHAKSDHPENDLFFIRLHQCLFRSNTPQRPTATMLLPKALYKDVLISFN